MVLIIDFVMIFMSCCGSGSRDVTDVRTLYAERLSIDSDGSSWHISEISDIHIVSDLSVKKDF